MSKSIELIKIKIKNNHSKIILDLLKNKLKFRWDLRFEF